AAIPARCSILAHFARLIGALPMTQPLTTEDCSETARGVTRAASLAVLRPGRHTAGIAGCRRDRLLALGATDRAPRRVRLHRVPVDATRAGAAILPRPGSRAIIRAGGRWRWPRDRM